MATAHSAVATGRDIRLDLFRGLALWFIFLDHIPTNIVSWLTVRNFGFSDALEIFVFISGYAAVIVYSRMITREGWLRTAAQIYRRVWQLYVAHILLFVACSAQVVWVSTRAAASDTGRPPGNRVGRQPASTAPRSPARRGTQASLAPVRSASR